MNNRWRLLTAAILCLTISNTVTADYNVRGKGRLMYRDGSDKKPLPRVRVQLMDEDIDLDEKLKTGRTNANGEFDLSGHGEDSWTVCSGCDHPDIYIKFILNEPHRVSHCPLPTAHCPLSTSAQKSIHEIHQTSEHRVE